jgi:transcriptional regulator with XRE-family HTH domain
VLHTRRAGRRVGVGSSPTDWRLAVARRGANGSKPEYREIGDRLRAARGGRGLSLRSLAGRLGVSASLISQVERGLAKPSVNTLYAMARELDVSLDELLFVDARSTPASDGARRPQPAEPGPLPRHPVQRATDRKSIRLASGVVWERLTTESIPNVDFLYVTYEVGGASSPERDFQRHGGQEWGFVLSGRLGVTVGFEDYVLEAGDSIAIDSTTPHRLFNLGSEPVHAIWFVLGRRPTDAGAFPSG